MPEFINCVKKMQQMPKVIALPMVGFLIFSFIVPLTVLAAPATLNVVVQVVNDNGGTKQADNFSLTVDGANGFSTTLNGKAAGELLTLDPGAYQVQANNVNGYTSSLSTDCLGVMLGGDNKTCTVTMDDITPVAITGILNIITQVVNNNGGTKQANNFILTVDGANGFSTSLNGNTSGQVINIDPGAYQVLASIVNGYTSSLSSDCSGVMLSGNSKTCTVTMDDNVPTATSGTLNIVTQVTNINGGTKQAGNFTLMVDGANGLSSTLNGNASGEAITLDPGAYTVTPTASSGYSFNASADCSGVILVGQSKVCTVTFNDQAQVSNSPSLTIITDVVNDNGGIAQLSAFSLTLDAANGFSTTLIASSRVTSLTLDPGAYEVQASTVNGYTTNMSTDCSGVILSNQSKTCTVTFNDVPANIPGGGGGNVICPDASVVSIVPALNEVDTPRVPLALVYPSNTTSISLSNYSDFRDGLLITPALNHNWQLLPVDGIKTVYGQFNLVNGCNLRTQTNVTLKNSATENIIVPPANSPAPRVLGAQIQCVDINAAKVAAKPTKAMTKAMRGQFVKQCSKNNELWYVDQVSGTRYYVPTEPDGINIVKTLALGINNTNLNRIPVSGKLKKRMTRQDTLLVNRLRGRLLLAVESRGELWYVNPKDGKRYFVGTDNTKVNNIANCVTDANLNKVAVGISYAGKSLNSASVCYPAKIK